MVLANFIYISHHISHDGRSGVRTPNLEHQKRTLYPLRQPHLESIQKHSKNVSFLSFRFDGGGGLPGESPHAGEPFHTRVATTAGVLSRRSKDGQLLK